MLHSTNCRNNICHTSPQPSLPTDIPLSAPPTLRHLSLQDFITNKEEVETMETKVTYNKLSSEESSRHSSSSSQVRDEEAEDPSNIGDDVKEEEDEEEEEVEDDNIFEDNQPLIKCPDTKEVLRENKSKSDH